MILERTGDGDWYIKNVDVHMSIDQSIMAVRAHLIDIEYEHDDPQDYK